MKVVTITCNECGAPLEVPQKTRFVTCSYCSSRLQVVHSGGASYSEVLERIDQRNAQIADDVEKLKLESELDRVDREWMMRREDYKIRQKNGHARVPSQGGSIVVMVMVAVFGIFWTVLAAGTGAPGFFPLFGVVFVVAAVLGGISSMSKAKRYERDKSAYEARRKEIYDKLHRG